MKITVIGTGFIGGILGQALARSGHQVTFGSRHADADAVAGGPVQVASISDALSGAEVVVLALPGGAVGELTAAYGPLLEHKLVIDATNKMGDPIANSRSVLPPTVRYARAFNTLGGEDLANPQFADGLADLFFSAPTDDRATVEEVIAGVGLRPVYVGEDQEAIIDALFRLWIELAITQRRGRRLALRLLEG